MQSHETQKGKTKKRREYMSIVLVPHSTGTTKTLKVSAFKLKFGILISFVVVLVLSISIIVVNTTIENNRLKKELSKANEDSAQKDALVLGKSNELKQIQDKEDSLNQKIKECMDKYKQLTDEYITKPHDTKSSRGGDRNEHSFSNDMQSYRNSLESLKDEVNSRDLLVSDISDADKKLDKYMDAIPTMWPVSGGRITSYFGGRSDPFEGRSKFHEGLDIAADEGKSIRASADGTVVYASYMSGYGNAVIINHGRNLSTLYGHSSRILVKEGQKVKKGDVIAKVGSTGRSTGPHLHFEIRVGGQAVDPQKYLDKK